MVVVLEEMYKSAVVWKIVIILCSRARAAALFLTADLFTSGINITANGVINENYNHFIKIIHVGRRSLLFFLSTARRNAGRLYTSHRARAAMWCRRGVALRKSISLVIVSRAGLKLDIITCDRRLLDVGPIISLITHTTYDDFDCPARKAIHWHVSTMCAENIYSINNN